MLCDHATPEEFLEGMEQLDVSLVLDTVNSGAPETGDHLGVRIDADEETTFAITNPTTH